MHNRVDHSIAGGVVDNEQSVYDGLIKGSEGAYYDGLDGNFASSGAQLLPDDGPDAGGQEPLDRGVKAQVFSEDDGTTVQIQSDDDMIEPGQSMPQAPPPPPAPQQQRPQQQRPQQQRPQQQRPQQQRPQQQRPQQQRPRTAFRNAAAYNQGMGPATRVSRSSPAMAPPDPSSFGIGQASGVDIAKSVINAAANVATQAVSGQPPMTLQQQQAAVAAAEAAAAPKSETPWALIGLGLLGLAGAAYVWSKSKNPPAPKPVAANVGLRRSKKKRKKGSR